MKDIRVASVQFEHQPGDKKANMEKIRSFTEEAQQQDVQMIVFPECCITGYWFLRKLSKEELAELAEPVFIGPSSKRLIEWSQESGMTIGAGLLEITTEGTLYNTYIVAMPDGTLRHHRKMHAFININIASGSDITVFDTPHDCRTGILICYDNNLIENARLTALQGAEILLSPHQTGGCASKSPHAMGLVDRALWENRNNDPDAIEAEFLGPKGRGWLMRWLPSRAHDNGMFLIFSNGVGVDDDEIRTGNAIILDPYGRILAETWKAGDDMVIADLDASLLDQCTGRRWIRARKPELYGPLTVKTGNERDTYAVRFGESDS